MLIELAIGDAYGAGFEYANEMSVYNDLSRYFTHPRHRLNPGSYTDDTQMSIAIAEVIVSGAPWTPQVLAESFVTCFKRDRRKGYASRFYDFLESIPDGSEFLDKIHPDSDKSGAAMRAGPIGVFATPEKVIEAATIQAALTHNTPDGINAGVAAALMTHYFIYQLGPKRKLGQFLEGYVSGEWSKPWAGKVKSKGWMSVRAAITAVMRNDSMSELLKDCIAFTGDVDTVATIALAAGSCSQEITQDIPHHLLMGLENGTYGRDYLIELDKQLMSLVRW
ncbi:MULTISPECIES: ADP-ribosylglycohydrolase family protein [unclassified Tolypothrix]|uniref:ADP-ribosylglycohydrolase family protein n=1 Tax=unclassified Tolypothrix TaxID=2649714 RepID=UPI0005EAB9DA|nr:MULTISPECIES: ADP-ribosylglycohydrolase family protein [unclassified Tolypothrix]BAY93121.1 ADP-ribosylation/crystallin J1 [Microchaete diplosiphon NIES-3275]EKF00375.1 ADP-ribosylglycohydrolase [Tolypothrix sp. PCC 7601]MBE9081858.1 ADP-ribosylglycohydrolase family protein [Tolypothrix sp. LEGE 11397]UYD26999.1 ADP-ribosylglycohydrolase family protein [Tolypothrix sp. PCC 7712]UYD37143.1 ADP-ribosylglycohydrolase family protein [Tolypothrix sp. PCC 7601]